MGIWILVRHGESVANAQKYLSGWQDVPLTTKGRTEALALKKLLQNALAESEQKLGFIPCVQLVSSDLQRAVETGKLATDGSFILQDRRFRERCFGTHQGRSKILLRKEGIMEQILSWTCDDPEIESFQQLAARILPAMDEYTSDVTVLFAHGGVIRTILGLLEHKSLRDIARWKIPNAVPYVVTSPKEGWSTLIPSDWSQENMTL